VRELRTRVDFADKSWLRERRRITVGQAIAAAAICILLLLLLGIDR